MKTIPLFCLLFACTAPAQNIPSQTEPDTPALDSTWQKTILHSMEAMGTGGKYACNRQARNSFIQTFQWNDANGLSIKPRNPRPSFCSSAVYTVILSALKSWNEHPNKPKITKQAWLALLPKGQQDGVGAWGYANANGPGMALLIHELKAGVNFTQWENAKPGDIMKLWWTQEIGAHERGHLTIYISHTTDSVTFWSSNQSNPQGEPGYGTKTVPRSKVKHVLFTRINSPQGFLQAPAIGKQKWLADMLVKDITPQEMHRKCGVVLSGHDQPAIPSPSTRQKR